MRFDVRRPGQAEHVDVAGQVLWVATAEALAADVLLREAERLHLGTDGAVEHHDALLEKCCQSFYRAHRPSPVDGRATTPTSGPGRKRGGSLGVW